MAAGDISKALKGIIRERLGDVQGLTWQDADIYRYMTEGQDALVEGLKDAVLWQLSAVAGTTLTAGVTGYALPSDLARIRLVKYKGIAARRWPLAELERLSSDYPTAPSESNPYYYVWGSYVYFSVGSVTQAGGETYEIWYIKRPADISASVDPSLADANTTAAFWQCRDLLETHAQARALEGNGDLAGADYWTKLLTEQMDRANDCYSGPLVHDQHAGDPIGGR